MVKAFVLCLTLWPTLSHALQWSERDILNVVSKAQGEISFLYLAATDEEVSDLHICERIGGILELAEWLPQSPLDLAIKQKGFTPQMAESLVALMGDLRKVIGGLKGQFCNSEAPIYRHRKALAREAFIMMSEVRAIKVTLFGSFGFEPLHFQ